MLAEVYYNPEVQTGAVYIQRLPKLQTFCSGTASRVMKRIL
jgi:hypothetical protein